ncbi:thyroid transcription factor 1-associated protein 26 homolog [Homalodisca vitripennis]|uniref:thyroid transcription factor 1-associated protein 26 homolog n=1 Tax=Homalodisca vitripennis TaxID=197043 RepID=UPI001EE9B51A|nr:thyroid transcription factor 1-associated protein 26 homolog [Homalodisca vitripennis]XP_046687163.1 thyroid transcription factor 1-associated protein 26 homolog [Homalodisca vitripennis]
MDPSTTKCKSRNFNGCKFGQFPDDSRKRRYKNDGQHGVKQELKGKKMHTKSFSSSAPDSKIKFKKHSSSTFRLAVEEYNNKKLEIQKQKEEMKNRKEETKQALQRYKETKAIKMKTLSRKTKKGQPVMKYRMQNLLERIQNGLK